MARGCRDQTPTNAISSPRSGRRAPRLGVVLLALSALFFSVNFAQAWWTSYQIRQQAAHLEAKIAAQRAVNAQLAQELPYFSSKGYIVSSARAHYGYMRPGDTVLITSQPPSITKTVYIHQSASEAPRSIVARLLQAIFQ